MRLQVFFIRTNETCQGKTFTALSRVEINVAYDRHLGITRVANERTNKMK